MSESKTIRVRLEAPSLRRATDFLHSVRCSRTLHRNRATPPSTMDGYREYVKKSNDDRHAYFLVIEDVTEKLVGVINISEIVRGSFQSAYLGYYAFVPHNEKGFIRAGLIRAINYAFRDQRLHRLEANIQPDNHKSVGLVRSLGFQLEGMSPRYLKIGGRWRDHERWAIRREEWRPPRNK